MVAIDIQWSTDLVTFFAPAQWGLPDDLPYDQWEAEVDADPLRFFERMLDGASEAGLTGIELAPAPGGWVNALRAYGGVKEFSAALRTRGLRVSSSYVLPTWLTDIIESDGQPARARAITAADDAVTRHAAFLAELGCEVLVTSTPPRASFDGDPAEVAANFARPADGRVLDEVAEHLSRAADHALREGVGFAIHTDAYSLCSRTDDVDRLLALTEASGVALCLDAGHIALDGGDPIEVLRRHGDRAPVLHWKDCAAHLAPQHLTGTPMQRHDVMIRNFRLMGHGILDWEEWTKVLKSQGWKGWGVAELDMSPDPIAEIRACLDYYTRELEPLAAR